MKKLFVSAGVVSAMFLSSCGGASLCDCVNGDKKGSEECKTMEKEFKAKFEKATDDEKEAMMKEMKACESSEEEAAH